MRDRFDRAFFPMRVLVGPVFRVAFRVTTRGLGNVPREGPAILAANHASFLDPIVVGLFAGRPVRFLVARDFYTYLPLRGAHHWFGAIPVGGRAGMIRSYRRIGEVVARGELLGIFPEGGITRDGHLRPFRDGAATIALKMGVPIVPLHVGGTYEALPRYARWPRFVPIHLRAGTPIDVAARRNPCPEDVAALTATLRTAIEDLAR